MAKRAYSTIGMDHDDVKLIQDSLAAPTGATLQAASPAPNSYTPPSTALRWLRMEGPNVTGNPAFAYPASGEVALAYLVGTLLIDATLGAGESGRLVTWNTRPSGGGTQIFYNLEWVYVSPSTFNLRLTTGNPGSGGARTTKGTGSTVFSRLEKITFRIAIDGTNITLHARQNNTDLSGLGAEITVAETELAFNRRIIVRAYDDLGAGEFAYFDVTGLIEADGTSDRPNGNWLITRLDPNGEGTSQGYGDNAVCDSTDAVYTDVLLDGSSKVDTATYWCEIAAQADRQEAALADFTPTRGLVGVDTRGAASANVASKTVSTDTSLYDGTTRLDMQNSNLGSTTWVCIWQNWERTPGVTEWQDEANLNSYQIGVESRNNGAQDGWAALIAQAYEIGDDPPPAAGQARSFGVIVG